MIPVRLQISGFLSYRDPVEIDFDSFNLACISGQNGAGKSSILDGITWALFGKARGKTDDDLINSHCDAAEVILDFSYEDNLYRVQRRKPRGKTCLLDFMVQDSANRWRTLSEAKLSDTEKRIVNTLHLDHETFINASFFQQGKADQFTQQSAGKRKQILSTILGLEIWESYRQQTAKTIRSQELEQTSLAGQMEGNEKELAREPEYLQDLKRLETEVDHLTELQKSKTAAVDAAKSQEAALTALQKILNEKISRLRIEQSNVDKLQQQFNDRSQERASFQKILAEAPQIEAKYQKWQADRKELEHWNSLAEKLREVNDKRIVQQAVIERQRTALTTQRDALRLRQGENLARERDLPAVEANLVRLKAEAEDLERQKQRKAELDEKVGNLRLSNQEVEIRGQALVRERDSLAERIARLGEAEEERCPVCKKPLSLHEREVMVVELQETQAAQNLQLRENAAQRHTGSVQMKSLVDQLNLLTSLDKQIQQNHQQTSSEETRRKNILESMQLFEANFAPDLKRVDAALEKEDFASEAREKIRQLDLEADQIGYDPTAHASVRQSELRGRDSEKRKSALDKASAALQPLEREISNLAAMIAAGSQALDELSAEKIDSEAEVTSLRAQLPDRAALEREALSLREQLNRKVGEAGGVRSSLKNLDNIRERQKNLSAQRAEISRQIALLKKLEHAFSKDGVPALLIEQALPEIETQANDLLERLSNGAMSLRFETQAEYKDTKRTEKKETLDIKISDSTGAYREYEMYSGGEAFRVNFAIRLALSRVLAHRAGARLQTLVIDEGFGSQDADGRQRLIEAINHVRPDFQKILVITHLDELKDAFPARVEVEKGDGGSTVRVQVL